MKKDTTVFTLSALDIFCSTMGVFMILCFIVLPSYMNESPPSASEQPKNLPAPPQKIEIIPSVTVAIHWESREEYTKIWKQVPLQDVDLQIDAPGDDNTRLHYHDRATTHSGSPAVLLVDSMRGGGEAWMHPHVTAGRYKVGFKVADIHEEYKGTHYDGLRVFLTLVSPSGKQTARPVELTGRDFQGDDSTYYHLADFEANQSGEITLLNR